MARPKLTPSQARAAREQVRGVMRQVAVEIDKLDVDSLRALVPVLAEAEKEVAAKLADFLSKHAGDERFTAQQQRRALVSIRSAIDEIKKLDAVAASMLGTMRSAAAAMAAKHVERELAAFGALFEHSIRPVSIDVAAVFARGEAMLVRRFAESRARYQIGSRIAEDIERQLALGTVQGESFEQLTRRLIKLGGPRGAVNVGGSVVEQINEGLFARHEHFAERLVRTESIEAYNQFADESIREASFEDPTVCRRWDDSGDIRECPLCRELRGCVVGVDQNFPGGIDHPPAHPNCRCAVIAWSSRWKEAGDVRFPLGKPQPPRTPGSGASKPAPAQQRPAPAAAPLPPAAPVHVFPTNPKSRPVPAVVPPLQAPQLPLVFPSKPPALVPAAVPAAAAAPAGFDVETLAQALHKAPTRGTAASRSGALFSQDNGKVIRDQLRALVEEFGAPTRDTGVARDTLLVKANLSGAHGWHCSDGEIALSEQRFVGMQRFVDKIADKRADEIVGSEVRGMRTVLHETTHGASPLPPGAYKHNSAAAVEEVTVEAHARRIIRDKFPGVAKAYDVQYPLNESEVDTTSRSGYDGWLHHMRRLVGETFGLKPEEAVTAIEGAAAKMRGKSFAKDLGLRGRSSLDQADGYVEHFVNRLTVPSTHVFEAGEGAAREQLANAIKGGAWKRWK